MKENFSTENYATKHLARNKRSLFAQLRIGILPLKIETGRFTNIPVDNRICVYCDSGEIEDEFHFVLSCEFYVDFRDILLQKCNELNNNFESLSRIEKMKYILSNKDIIIYSVNYTASAFYRRKCSS